VTALAKYATRQPNLCAFSEKQIARENPLDRTVVRKIKQFGGHARKVEECAPWKWRLGHQLQRGGTDLGGKCRQDRLYAIRGSKDPKVYARE